MPEKTVQDLPKSLRDCFALSIRQPWAWLIACGYKDIENRDWRISFRGTFLIHAGKGMTRGDYEDAAYYAQLRGIQVPPMAELERGGIVGVAELVDCVNDHDSHWFEGKFGFVLRNAKPVAFIPCKGALGLFQPELPEQTQNNERKEMESQIKTEHWNDAEGNPAGGSTYGPGFAIAWQNGPLGRGNDRREPNGAFVENIIRAAADRIEYYQASKFACERNAKALDHLYCALEELRLRTADREARDVEGTHKK